MKTSCGFRNRSTEHLLLGKELLLYYPDIQRIIFSDTCIHLMMMVVILPILVKVPYLSSVQAGSLHSG